MAGFKAHSEKQGNFLFSEKRISILASGIQYGKTTVGVAWLKVLMHRHTHPMDNFIVASPSYKILVQSTLPPFMDVNKGCGRLDKQEWCFHMHNGGKVWFRTNTNPDSVVGITNVRGILGDEAGKYGRYFWDNLQARASFKQAPIGLVTSPYSLNWLYKDFIRPFHKNDEYIHSLVALIQARSDENPYFPRGEYEDRRRTMDSRRFNMIYGGQFDKAEGLVYDIFDEDSHVIDPITLPPDTKYFAGIDWGYRDPFIISVRAVTPLGMHYSVAEYCYPQKTLTEMIEAAWRFKRLFNVEVFYADPSRPDYINEFCRAGLTCIKADNDIRLGIDSHYELIKEGRYQVFRNTSPYLLDEYSQYHYPELKDLKPDQNTKDELPVDQNNHCIAEGTLILTDRGLVPIEQVTTSDKVKTRGKFNRVISSGISGFNRDIVEVKVSSGNSLRCTPDHKIWTNKGFLRADHLRYGDILLTIGDKKSWKLKKPSGLQVWTIFKKFVKYVKKNLRQTSMPEQKLAHPHVVGVYPAGQSERVYDLTVAVEHEFFANGILVHNCMDCQRYITMAQYRRYGHKPNRIYTHSDVYDLSKSSKSVYYDSEHSKLYKPSKKKNNHIL